MLTMIVTFGRGPRSQLHDMVAFTKHVQRDPVTRVRVRGRSMFFGRGDISFYFAWREQGYTYYATSKWYGARPRDLRSLVASVQPLL